MAVRRRNIKILQMTSNIARALDSLAVWSIHTVTRTTKRRGGIITDHDLKGPKRALSQTQLRDPITGLRGFIYASEGLFGF